MGAKHVLILFGHVIDEFFLLIDSQHIFADMRGISGSSKHHHQLQVGGSHLFISLIGQRGVMGMLI